jgi:hypothetical protein
MTERVPRDQRKIKSFSSPDTVRLTVPLPAPGELAEAEFPRMGLRVVVERLPQEAEEQIRKRFVVTAPVGKDNRTHAARLGSGQFNPKKLGVTLCTEEKADSLASGNRITGLTLDAVTCGKCVTSLVHEGVVFGSNGKAES